MLEIDKYTPKPNYYVGLLFKEGYWIAQLIRKQQRTVYKGFEFNSGTAISAGSTSGWEEPNDDDGRYYLEPQEEEYIYQVFTGLSPSTARMYFAYPERVDRMNLISVRSVPGDIGYWDGEDTPFRNPSPETEIWTVHDLYPSFNVENPGIANESQVIRSSFWITPFSYNVIEDPKKVKEFIRGDRRITMITMGDPDRGISAPNWIRRDYDLTTPEEVL